MNSSRKNRIENHIQEHFKPQFLDVINESSQHRVPDSAETHFKLVVVAQPFEGQSRIQRQRLILQLLKQEFSQGLHACSMSLYSPSEWEKNPAIIHSPACAHKSETSL